MHHCKQEPTKSLSDDEQVEHAKQLLRFHGYGFWKIGTQTSTCTTDSVREMNAEIDTDSDRSTLQGTLGNLAHVATRR